MDWFTTLYTRNMSKISIFIVILVIFSFSLRLFRLNEPNRYYFDEVYHAVTAEAIANNNPDAYNPHAPPPKKNTAYDWLHPPLAKLIQAGSIKLFGDKPFSWRLPSAVFGTILVFSTFLLAYFLFGKKVAVFSSIIIAFENLNLVMSRITMNDIFVTSFIVISFIFAHFYLKNVKLKYAILTGLFLGLSIGSKWTGVYAIFVIMLYIAIYSKNKFSWKHLLVAFIPAIIYLLSYSQFWLQGHSIADFKNLHEQILGYQKRADLAHPYGTTPLYCTPEGLDGPRVWCPWIFDVRPVYFSYEQYGLKAGYIYALGNPLVYWFGVLGVIFVTWKLLKNGKKSYFLILFGYLIFWVPWIFSPRILFMYHYLPSIPFLSISLGVMLASLYKTKYKYLSILILFAIIALFIYFYPISTGYPINSSVLDNHMWFETWR